MSSVSKISSLGLPSSLLAHLGWGRGGLQRHRGRRGIRRLDAGQCLCSHFLCGGESSRSWGWVSFPVGALGLGKMWDPGCGFDEVLGRIGSRCLGLSVLVVCADFFSVFLPGASWRMLVFLCSSFGLGCVVLISGACSFSWWRTCAAGDALARCGFLFFIL